MQLFYCPDIYDNYLTLPPEEGHHIFHVLRLSSGAEIQVTDGNGRLLTVRLTEVSKKNVIAEIIAELPVKEPTKKLHVAIAPTKNSDRFEWFLEKATEIGITNVTPLLCQRSERKEIKPERLEKLIVAAAKQSQHVFFPKLNPMISFPKFIEQAMHQSKCIAHCMEEPKVSFKNIITNDTLILIGPEGDFSPQELKFATEHNYKSVSLGDSRLRTETAAVVACALFSI